MKAETPRLDPWPVKSRLATQALRPKGSSKLCVATREKSCDGGRLPPRCAGFGSSTVVLVERFGCRSRRAARGLFGICEVTLTRNTRSSSTVREHR